MARVAREMVERAGVNVDKLLDLLVRAIGDHWPKYRMIYRAYRQVLLCGSVLMPTSRLIST
jgi:ferritin-like protein